VLREILKISIGLFLVLLCAGGCVSMKSGEFIPTDGKIQWIASDGKMNLMLFGDYEQIKDQRNFRITHNCQKTYREIILLQAQKTSEPGIGLIIKQSRLNMLAYSAGMSLIKDTAFVSQNNINFRMQVIHSTSKQGPLTELRYIWEDQPMGVQFHFWSKRENQETLFKEAEGMMNSFSNR